VFGWNGATQPDLPEIDQFTVGGDREFAVAPAALSADFGGHGHISHPSRPHVQGGLPSAATRIERGLDHNCHEARSRTLRAIRRRCANRVSHAAALGNADRVFDAGIEERALLLADRGHHRTPSIPDLIIAATAELAGLSVLHLDKDFDLMAEVIGQAVELLRI
jgi:predicted nucleic acid-binding protein